MRIPFEISRKILKIGKLSKNFLRIKDNSIFNISEQKSSTNIDTDSTDEG